MSIVVRNREGDRGLPLSPGQTIARVGVCAGGAVNTVYTFDPGQERQVPDTLGYGPLATATSRSLVVDGAVRCLAVKSAASVAGSIKSVVQTGSGPAMTVSALTTPSNGPWFDLNLKIAITKGGALGTAAASVALDGKTIGYEFDLPAEKPAKIRGTVDLTTITLGDLNTLTFDLSNVDGANPSAITFSSVETIADVVSQVDAIAGLSASLISGKYLEISAVTLGPTGALTVANGTANALLGFTNTQTAAGTASSFIVPGAGVELVFATGTYVKDTTYTVPLTGPRMSLADYEAALSALRESGEAFAGVIAMQAPVDGADLASWQSKNDLVVGGWHQASENPIYPFWLLNSPLGGTGDSNITTNDGNVRDEMAGKGAIYGAVVHGDIYITTIEYAGVFRWPAVVTAGERCATRRLSEDLGYGGAGDLQNAQLRGPTGTKIRTEARAVVKMKDRGFIVLKDEGGAPRFVRGRTRYNAGSNLVSLGVLRAVFEADRIVRELLKLYENDDPPTDADGQIETVRKQGLIAAFDGALKSGLVDTAHFSAAFTKDIVLIPNAGTDKMVVTYTLQRKAQIEDVEGDLVIVRQIGG